MCRWACGQRRPSRSRRRTVFSLCRLVIMSYISFVVMYYITFWSALSADRRKRTAVWHKRYCTWILSCAIPSRPGHVALLILLYCTDVSARKRTTKRQNEKEKLKVASAAVLYIVLLLLYYDVMIFIVYIFTCGVCAYILKKYYYLLNGTRWAYYRSLLSEIIDRHYISKYVNN